jgi:signal transduction histidine kinase/ABC-type nitrate/sulfonate/bicarbonate transport system substrate-binding protein
MRFILLLLSFLTFALSNQNESNKVSLQLLWKHQFEFAGYYMAKEKGLYKELGLDVELKEYDFSIDITKDIENGKSTFGIGYPSIILEKSMGSKILFLNSTFQSSPHVFVTLASSNINNISDFKNKTIMMGSDTVKTASLLSMLYANKINNGDFLQVKPSFNIEDLIHKKVDIFSSYLSNEVFKLDELGIKYNIFNPKDYGFDMYNDILFTSSKLAKNNPELVYKFQKASLDGWKYAFENIDETVEVILKKYNTQNKSKQALKYEAKILKRLAYQNQKPLGDINPLELKRIFDLYSLMGVNQGTIKETSSYIFNYKPTNIILTKSEKNYLKNKKLFTYCINPNWMPYEMYDKKLGYIGLGADYIQLFEDKLNIPFKLIPTKSWSQSVQFAKDRVCDILPLSNNSLSRKEFMNITTAHVKESIVIATKIDTKFIIDFNNLKGKKVGISQDYSLINRFKKDYPFIEIIETKNIQDGLKKVKEGKLFGQIDTISSINYYISKNYNGKLKVAGKFNEFYTLGVASNKDEPLINSILQKVVDIISKEEKQNIYQKWENKTKVINTIDYTLIYEILIIASIIIFFIIYRQTILRQANKNLQETVEEKTKELLQLNQELEEKIKLAVKNNSQKDAILFQQSKMASMGEMIGNIAHQWRQPLSHITTLSTGIIYKYDAKLVLEEKEVRDIMEKLNNTAQFLSQTIDDFQNFMNPKTSNEQFDIQDIIHKNIELFGKAFRNNNIDFILDLKSITINNNQNALLQVLVNILNNAKDALKENQLDEKYIFIKLYKNNNNAIIEILDNAGGIDENIIDKVFEAYFTTKHQAQGTGLGLFMCYQIISSNFHGELDVANETFEYDGKNYTGAKFTIRIPC